MDMEKLAAEAAVAAAKELTTTTIKAGAAGAGQLWAWIRGNAPAEDAATIASIEAQPEKASTKDKLRGVLKDILDGRPELQAELEALLAQPPARQSATQSATATGGSKVAQVAGNKNKTTIG
jgi:hypothetical protein